MSLSLIEIGIIALLATYRLTFMFYSEEGPAHIFARFRIWAGVRYDQYSNPIGSNWFAEGLICYFCLSVWIATLVTAALVLGALSHVLEGVLIVLAPFALSGGAIYLKKAVG